MHAGGTRVRHIGKGGKGSYWLPSHSSPKYTDVVFYSSTAPLNVEAESEEEKTKKKLKEKIRREFLAAVHFEGVVF